MSVGCPHCGLSAPSETAVGLTEKQRELLVFLEGRMPFGTSPSFDEIMAALGLRSKNGVHRLLTALEERGCIRRLPNRWRSIVVVGKPSLRSAA